ncbi:flagellar assembly protein FliX [Oceanicaulis sp. MMSF_3324]|uniref:flagellar assembly protein FliX n=1 Tax=Oceanicaulis sp. MMSF_3324 TaxID=3046702 RepID=UPI00273D3E89|nr:flagellar assembly protein FliX [Oceanicaulis sp. MMSF_3324]
MKVNSSRPVQGASSAKRKDAASSASGFAPESTTSSGGAVSTTALSSASAIGSVDALLALQGAGDSLSGKRQATERAFSLLDILDDLKLALLDGVLPQETLAKLMETLQSRRDATHDPRLEAALDEVEIRAAVELAKLGA